MVLSTRRHSRWNRPTRDRPSQHRVSRSATTPSCGARLAGRRRRARKRVRGMSEVAKPPSESAGEGVAERGVRVSCGRVGYASHTSICERIGWGGCGCKKCPGVTKSYCSYNYVRIESAGEGVAVKSARVSCGCVRDDATRVSVQDRSWRAVAHLASGCHDIVLWTRSPVSTTKRVTLRAPVSIRFVPSHSHAMVIRGWWIRRHDTRTPSSHALPSRFYTYVVTVL